MKRAELGEYYWVIDTNGKVFKTDETNNPLDEYRYEFGNYFPDKESAEIAAEKIKALLHGEENPSKEVAEHPSHYNQYPIEVIDMMERIFGVEKAYIWCILTAFKYRMRMGYKDDVKTELEKEQWYLAKAEELKKKFVRNIW